MQSTLPADVLEALARHGLAPASVALEPAIPLSAFREHGILEAASAHLLTTGMSATRAAALLNRSPTTIRNSARAASQRSTPAVGAAALDSVPARAFSDAKRKKIPASAVHAPDRTGGQALRGGAPAVPTRVLADRERSPLYALTAYLHEQHGWSFSDIARAIGRDPRSVSAAYRRGGA